MRDAIREYMAKTFFACAWADWQERYCDENLSGVEIMDAIPDDYPESAYEAADKLITGLEKLNGVSLEIIYETCRDEPGEHEKEPDEDEFGYCMAMQAMGNGVGWDDNHPSMFHEKRIDWVNPKINRPARFKVPYLEYNYYNLPDSEYPISEKG